MDLISKLQTIFEEYPQLSYTVEDNYLSVDPPKKSGFSVWLQVHEQGFTVGFDGWHDTFEDETQALKAIALGLSNKCRLKVFKRGNFEYKWALEADLGYELDALPITGLLIFPFWRKQSVEYRQNQIIVMPNQILNRVQDLE